MPAVLDFTYQEYAMLWTIVTIVVIVVLVLALLSFLRGRGGRL